MTSGIRTLRSTVVGSILRLLTVVLFVGLVSGPASANAEDMVLKWNDIAARTAVATSPFNGARVLAIVQLSVFESVNAITETMSRISIRRRPRPRAHRWMPPSSSQPIDR